MKFSAILAGIIFFFKGAIQQWYQNRFQSTIETDWVLYSPSVIYSVAKLIELKSERGDYIVCKPCL